MMQLKVEKVKYGLIPCYVVYPIRETGKTVIFIMAGAARENCRSIGRRSWPFMGIQFLFLMR